MADLVILEKQDLEEIADAIRLVDSSSDPMPFAVLKETAVEKILSTNPNKGLPWSRATFSGTQPRNVICMHSYDGMIIAGARNGLFYSTDGKNWAQAPNTSSFTITCICYDEYSEVWYAGTDGSGLLYSYDGETWSSVSSAILQTLTINDVCSNQYGFIYAATESGLWYYDIEEFDPFYFFPLTTYNTSFSKVWAHERDGYIIAAGDDGVEYSVGFTVANEFYTTNIVEPFYCITSPYNVCQPVIGCRSGIYYSADIENYTQTNQGCIYAICCNGGYKMVAAGNNLIAYSEDGGQSWENIRLAAQIGHIEYHGGMWLALGYYTQDDTDVYAIYASKDGLTWDKTDIEQLNLSASYGISILHADLSSTNGVWLVGVDNGILYAESENTN